MTLHLRGAVYYNLEGRALKVTDVVERMRSTVQKLEVSHGEDIEDLCFTVIRIMVVYNRRSDVFNLCCLCATCDR